MFYLSQRIIQQASRCSNRVVCQIRTFGNEMNHFHTKVCTPIYYVNGDPHIGHIYSTTLADAICRWENMKGNSSYLTTGTDEHGQKVKKEADKRKMDVKKYCDGVASSFQKELSNYSLNIGRFIRTTDNDHEKVVLDVWDKLMKNDDLYLSEYQGYYCRSDEAFLTKKQIYEKDGQMLSLENNNPVEWIEEKNWMFRIQKYKPQLIDFLNHHPDWITPSYFQKEVINIVTESSSDLSVSRPLSRVPWSIPCDKENGIYVWIDALSNYLTTSQDKCFDSIIHVFGKDILKFHCYYYPCLLMALNLPLPNHMICHNHWTINENKISKSKGNYIPLEVLRSYFPGELIRFYLLSHDTLQHDGNFATHYLLQSIHQVADIYGNLVMRSLSKNIAGPLFEWNELSTIHVNKQTTERLEKLTKEVTKQYDAFSFCNGFDYILNELKTMNQQFNDDHPWTLAKEIRTKASTSYSELATKLVDIWESLRVCSILLQPLLPTYSQQVLKILHCSSESSLCTPLDSVFSSTIHPNQLTCNSDRLFTKLSKQQESTFLKL